MYKFQPIIKTLVWGTESWVLSGVPGNESVVAEGPDAGKKIIGGEIKFSATVNEWTNESEITIQL